MSHWNRSCRIEWLKKSLSERIVLLDGGMGTMIQQAGLSESDYRGDEFADWSSDLKGNNDLLTLTQGDAAEGYITALFLSMSWICLRLTLLVEFQFGNSARRVGGLGQLTMPLRVCSTTLRAR